MLSILDGVLRAVSYCFHLLLGLVLLVMAGTVLLGPEATFTLGILPWQGRTLAWVLLVAGAAALEVVYLAIRRGLPALLLVWSVAVLAVLAYGYFLGRYFFGREGPMSALWLVGAAAVATLGSWRAVRRRRRLGSVIAERFRSAS